MKTKKRIIVLIVLIILASLVLISNVLLDQINLAKKATFGVSFSPEYASSLGLEADQVFLSALEDLKVKNIRLNTYWNEVEPFEGYYNFSQVDYYLDIAKKHQAKIILTIGLKQPRWPECHQPFWTRNLATRERQKRQLLLVEKIVKHFDKNPNIIAWQVENEPLLQFGTCPEPDAAFLEKEVNLVKSLSQKPIVLTDSGELSTWIRPMQLGDYFGTTLYRVVHNNWVGLFPYPLQPWFYRTKAFLIKNLFARENQKIILVELQTEPWAYIFIADIPIEEQISQFKVKDFEKNILFAKKTGFEESYLWGVEWWYFMKSKGHPEYWEYAKTLF